MSEGTNKNFSLPEVAQALALGGLAMANVKCNTTGVSVREAVDALENGGSIKDGVPGPYTLTFNQLAALMATVSVGALKAMRLSPQQVQAILPMAGEYALSMMENPKNRDHVETMGEE